MRRRGVIVVLAMALAGLTAAVGAAGSGAGEVETPTSGTFTALSYNVAGLPQELSGSDPTENTPYIAPLLNDFDLVLLQESWTTPDELTPDQQALLDLFGGRTFHEILHEGSEHPYRSISGAAPLQGNPLRPTAFFHDGLNRFSNLEFDTDVTRVMWPSCNGILDAASDCLATKGFSFARTTVAPGVEIDIYNLHAEAGNGPLDQAAREEGFVTLAQFIQDHSANRAVIVGGDYNLHSGSGHSAQVFANFLAATGLQNPCDTLDCGADAHNIDKFTYRNGDDVTIDVLSYAFPREDFRHPVTNADLSDHPPLVAEFAWSTVTPEPGAIEGRVVDEAGDPIEGAWVWAYDDDDGWVGTALTTTGADGRYRLDDIPPGEYRLMFRGAPGANMVTEWWNDELKRANAPHLSVGAGTTLYDVDAALAGGGKIQGIAFAADGAGGFVPRAGITVWAYGPTDGWVGTVAATTAADGSYVLEGLPPGAYKVFFRGVDTTWHTHWWNGANRGVAPSITVEPGTVSIASTRNGAPILSQ